MPNSVYNGCSGGGSSGGGSGGVGGDGNFGSQKNYLYLSSEAVFAVNRNLTTLTP